MKIFFIIMSIILALATGILSAVVFEGKGQIQTLGESLLAVRGERDTLVLQTIKLQQEKQLLEKIATPKAFLSKSSLDDWCKANVSAYNGSTTYSEDAVRLMNLARQDGYFMGIVGLEMTTDKTGQKVVKIPVYPYIDWTVFYVFNIAIVGESDIYIIDPAIGSTMKSAEMKAKFGWGSLP